MTMPIDTTPTPPSAPGARTRRAAAGNVVALVLATILLGAAVAVGYWMIDSGPVAPTIPNAEQLVSQAQHSIYGGDAYTGIQNAAADTENSVVAGTNSVTAFASVLQASQLQADAAWWEHLSKGVAALIVAIAAANFITVLQRFSVGRQAT